LSTVVAVGDAQNALHTRNTQQPSLVQRNPTPLAQNSREAASDFGLAKDAPVKTSLPSTFQVFLSTVFLRHPKFH